MIDLSEYFDSGLPIGFMAEAPLGMADPAGLWKECVGSVLVQSVYPTLFSRLGHRPAISGALTRLGSFPSSSYVASSFHYQGGSLIATINAATANRLFISTDNGATWVAKTGTGNSRLCTDCLNTGTHLAVLNQDNSTSQIYVSYSADGGATWADVGLGATGTSGYLTNASGWYFASSAAGHFWTSASLTSGWAARTGSFQTINGYAAGNGVLVVVGDESGAAKISCQASATGNFTVCTVPVSGASSVAGVVFVAGKFVARGYYTAGGSWIATSTDGVNWTARLTTAKTIYDVRHNGTHFFASQSSQAILLVSADAVSWSELVCEQHSGASPRLAFSANFGYVVPGASTAAYCGTFKGGASVSVQASLLQTSTTAYALDGSRLDMVPLNGGLVFAGPSGAVFALTDPYAPAANFQIPLRPLTTQGNRYQIKVK